VRDSNGPARLLRRGNACRGSCLHLWPQALLAPPCDGGACLLARADRYDLAERAAGFFRFFAAPAPGFTGQATSVVAAGLAAGEDPQEAVQATRALRGYEIVFWDVLAAGLDRSPSPR
jgi:hypothetical protein